ncbi:hypothetical protein [Paenibacillus brevis]|uniref:Uncharacterized protein n=1 Tax=Paenibacillus brevis TaxID=2841508 RepID=A0ABS6FRE1_9BACL|nr:hypothetical protein [Paenibacillus brevis]MBU5672756.1 hypothetical protein [Paenibacillus brevis]
MDKKWLIRSLLVAVSTVILCAWLIGPGRILPQGGALSAASVAAPVPSFVLTDDNLVDGLASLELPVRIAKVDLNGQILSIDLRVAEEQFVKQQLYRSMAEVISFAMEDTSNIDQLLLRLIAEDQWLGTRYLLLAADVRRGAWPVQALEELRNPVQEELSPSLIRWFRITVTHLWKEHIPD